MPTLNWIGKNKVINHHLDVPYRTLEKRYEFTSTTPSKTSANTIIQGDNLEALKALLPFYENRVKCIYIDPPYNTGKDDWKYNDNVDDPRLLKWLDQVVGKEGEDLTRHDKWLCMMYPRLVLLQKLLSPDGAIFVSIDDNEQANLKLIMDEVFGVGNFLGNIIWETATDNNPTQISIEHEYVLCYAKNKFRQTEWTSVSNAAELIEAKYNELKAVHGADIKKIQKELRSWIKENKEELDKVTHYDNVDEKGVFHDADVANTKFGGYVYDIIHPITGKVCKVPEKGYRFPKSTMADLIADKEIMFGADETTLIKPKKRLENVQDRLRSVIYEDGRGSTKELEQMFHKDVFKNPKSQTILKRLLSFCTTKDDIVLDSFAGSGTTAHAVLNLNKQDGGNRQFILIEMEDYAETITAERVKRVMNGYADKEGTGGNFAYYSLGERLFDQEDELNPAVGLDAIRQYIWYSETKTSIPDLNGANDSSYFLGTQGSTFYFFCYESHEATVLNQALLHQLKLKEQAAVIYADSCTLSKAYLTKHKIIFKKIPRDISKL